MKIRTNKKIWLYTICFFPFFDINGLWYITGNTVRYGIGLLCIGILSVYLIAKHKSIRLDSFMFMFLGYEGVTIVSTLLHKHLTLGILYSIVAIWFFLQLIHYEKEAVLESFFYLFTVLIALNLFSMPYFREEVYITETTALKGRFASIIGGRNSLYSSLIPMITFICLWYLKKAGKLTFSCKIWIIMGLFSILLGKSSTGIVVVALAGILFILLPKLTGTMKGYFAFFVLAYVSLVFLNTSLVQSDVFLWILERLNRNANMSFRPTIWNEVMQVIRENIWIGCGRGADFQVELIKGYHQSFAEAHNTFLQIGLQSGILGIIFYLGMIGNAAFRLRTRTGKVHKVLIIGIICFLVGGLMESMQDKLLFFVLLGMANEYSKERGSTYGIQNFKNDGRVRKIKTAMGTAAR